MVQVPFTECHFSKSFTAMAKYQKKKGALGEQAVKKYITEKGYNVIAENYTVRGGEIDLIAANGDELHFIEVKTRKSSDLYTGLESIDIKKQKRIAMAAVKFCTEHGFDLQPCFDAALVCMEDGIVLSIDYYENAFETTGFDLFI